MLKVHLDQTFRSLEGKPIREKEGEDLTLGVVCARALMTALPGDDGLTGEKVLERWKLATRLHAGGEVELAPEEAAEIRARLPKIFVLAVAAQAYEMLNGS